MMPWTAERLADDQSLLERPLIMGAFRADGEELVADAGEDDRLSLDLAAEEPVLANIANRDAKRQIGSGLLFISCRHGTLLMGAPASGQSSPAPAACSWNGVSAGRFPAGIRKQIGDDRSLGGDIGDHARR